MLSVMGVHPAGETAGTSSLTPTLSQGALQNTIHKVKDFSNHLFSYLKESAQSLSQSVRNWTDRVVEIIKAHPRIATTTGLVAVAAILFFAVKFLCKVFTKKEEPSVPTPVDSPRTKESITPPSRDSQTEESSTATTTKQDAFRELEEEYEKAEEKVQEAEVEEKKA